MRVTIAAAMLAAMTVAAPAQAAPVVYDITFTTTVGTATPTGFFTYDAAVGPPAGTFSDFLVMWRGVTHDFTEVANRIDLGGGGCGAGASSFAIMSGTTACETNQIWGVDDFTTFEYLDFFASSSALVPNIFSMDYNASFGFFVYFGRDTQRGGGTFTITARDTAVPVPEPMTLALFGLGLAGLAAARRRDPRGAR